jgi:hypothetical protein
MRIRIFVAILGLLPCAIAVRADKPIVKKVSEAIKYVGKEIEVRGRGLMLDDFERQVGEDDLTHLPEILEHHDLTKDLAAGSVQEFHKRSMDNLSNRCLHHHVFDEHNSSELLSKVGFDVLALEFRLPFHICILARMVRS